MKAINGYTSWAEIQRMPNSEGKAALISLFLLEFKATKEELIPFEWIRLSGKYNMITEFSHVKNMLMKIQAYDTLAWIQRCNDYGIPFITIIDYSYKFYGDSLVVDDELKLEFELRETQYDLEVAKEALNQKKADLIKLIEQQRQKCST